MYNHFVLENFDNLPDTHFIRIGVVNTILGISKSTFYRLIKNGSLNKYNLTPRTAVVNVGELRRYIQSVTGSNSRGGK